MPTVTEQLNRLSQVDLSDLIGRLVDVRLEVDRAAEDAKKAKPGNEEFPVEKILSVLQEAKRRGIV
jgi:hypothetical protein